MVVVVPARVAVAWQIVDVVNKVVMVVVVVAARQWWQRQ